jgi:hypothetical protein
MPIQLCLSLRSHLFRQNLPNMCHEKMARSENLFLFYNFLKTAGLNFRLGGRKVRPELKKEFSILADFDRKYGWWAILDLNQ